MAFDRTLHLRDGDSHVLGKCCTRLEKLYDSASSVAFAMPGNFIRGRLVHSKREWRFVLPHLSRHIIPLSQFIDQTVTVYSVKRFCREELDLGIGAGFPRNTHANRFSKQQMDLFRSVPVFRATSGERSVLA